MSELNCIFEYSRKWGRRLAWMNRDFLLEFRRKREVYGPWKQGQVSWEDYRDTIHHCREKTGVTKAQLELKLASTVWDNKRDI